MLWLRIPKKVYFKRGCMPVALRELHEVYRLKRAFIVSDPDLYREGVVGPVDRMLNKQGIRTAEYLAEGGLATFRNAGNGLQKMEELQPEVIIGVGGAEIMSLAKIMWLLYENPDIDLEKTADRFGEISASEDGFPPTGQKAKLVLIPTAAGFGLECSPFAVAGDDAGKKRIIADYGLIPEMAVLDADFAQAETPEAAKDAGRKALTLAVRSLTSEGATDYAKGFAMDAARMVLENLPAVVEKGTKAPIARETLANAATLAGMAAGNSLKTIDPAWPLYPAEEDMKPSGPEAEIIGELAKQAGFGSVEKWLEECRKLEAL